MLYLFCRELLNVWRICRPLTALRFFALVVGHFPSIVRERKLYAADRGMRGIVEYRLLGRWIPVDLEQYRDGTPFAFLREFAGRNAYFRCFDPDRLRFDVAVDAGANAGIVSEALSVLGGGRNRVLSVEALFHSGRTWDALLERCPNIVLIRKALLDGQPESAAYLRSLAPGDSLELTTMPALMAAHGVDRVSFMKIDIEGGEFSLLRHDNAWLAAVDNIAMEVHRDVGPAEALVGSLRQHGFDVVCTDDFGRPVAPRDSDYVYASRTGALKSGIPVLKSFTA